MQKDKTNKNKQFTLKPIKYAKIYILKFKI